MISEVAKTLERVDSGHGHYDVYYAASLPPLSHGCARVEGAPCLVAWVAIQLAKKQLGGILGAYLGAYLATDIRSY